MRAIQTISVILLLFICGCTVPEKKQHEILSPDGSICVKFELLKGEPFYSVYCRDSLVIEKSKLGIIRDDEDFSRNLRLDSVSDIVSITDSYTMLHGKRRNCSYQGEKRVFYLSSAASKPVEIIFQVSNDGAAFRYHFPGHSDIVLNIRNESTTFNFKAGAKAFLQPCPDSRTGWESTQPSYEEQYQREIKVGTQAPQEAGWVMPALFKSGRYWIALTETAVDTNYCGSRLSQYSPGGEYSIRFPQPAEGKTGEPVLPQSLLPWYTPWRIIALSDNLATLVESTLGTDLALPAQYDVSSWVKPGRASWSWIMYKDESITYNTQKEYIDFASSMSWEYCLIDVNWDSRIGYGRIKELADYAAARKVRLLLWYNSAGDWNSVTFYTPHDKMLTHESREAEFRKLKEMGIAGIKVDFFAGDGQSMIKYYTDILKDAAKYNIAVVFHGCTYPRGWARTYPNLMSMEAVRGEEFITFNQSDADAQPAHCTTIPFTRNLFDPMDFTPVNFSGIPTGVERRTTKGFELALSVIFLSGTQHFAESGKGMSGQSSFIREYMKSIPASWNDTKFIDGYPGRFVIIARKAGERWYIAGINGENKERSVRLQLPFLNDALKGVMITDSVATQQPVRRMVDLSESVSVKMYPYGGFVIITDL